MWAKAAQAAAAGQPRLKRTWRSSSCQCWQRCPTTSAQTLRRASKAGCGGRLQQGADGLPSLYAAVLAKCVASPSVRVNVARATKCRANEPDPLAVPAESLRRVWTCTDGARPPKPGCSFENDMTMNTARPARTHGRGHAIRGKPEICCE